MSDPTHASGAHDDSDEARAQRAAERAQRMTVRKFNSFEEAEAADEEFWAAMTPAERFAATCEMGPEWEAWRGRVPNEPRVSRAVERVRRS